MKPDWKDAPEWANWLAEDSNNGWFWYEFKPEKEEFCYNHDGPGRSQMAIKGEFNGVLENRPNSP